MRLALKGLNVERVQYLSCWKKTTTKKKTSRPHLTITAKLSILHVCRGPGYDTCRPCGGWHITGILIFLSNIRLHVKHGICLQLFQKQVLRSTYKWHISVVFYDSNITKKRKSKQKNPKNVTCQHLTNLTLVIVSVCFQLKCGRQFHWFI